MKQELIIGKPLRNGYILDACDQASRIVLAHSPRPETPQPWVIWHLDQDNDTWGGTYFTYKEVADSAFKKRR